MGNKRADIERAADKLIGPHETTIDNIRRAEIRDELRKTYPVDFSTINSAIVRVLRRRRGQ